MQKMKMTVFFTKHDDGSFSAYATRDGCPPDVLSACGGAQCESAVQALESMCNSFRKAKEQQQVDMSDFLQLTA